MKTRVLHIGEGTDLSEQEALLREAGDCIQSGGLVAFPTETVYGLGGDAFSPEAAGKIYAAKGRPPDNPLIVHIARKEDIEALCPAVPEAAKRLMTEFWPGPLTVVVNKRPEVPDATTGGLPTVAVRLPGHEMARALIRAAGGFVAAPSANRSGRPSPTLAEHCLEDLDGRVDFIIDGGAVPIGIESTVVDLTGAEPVVLRPGFITPRQIAQALPGKAQVRTGFSDQEEAPVALAPGMKYRHYAPRGALRVMEGSPEEVRERICAHLAEDEANGLRTGVICAEEMADAFAADYVAVYGKEGDSRAYARNLFRLLREMDARKIARIYAQAIDTEGIGAAAMNRLLKAAGEGGTS